MEASFSRGSSFVSGIFFVCVLLFLTSACSSDNEPDFTYDNNSSSPTGDDDTTGDDDSSQPSPTQTFEPDKTETPEPQFPTATAGDDDTEELSPTPLVGDDDTGDDDTGDDDTSGQTPGGGDDDTSTPGSGDDDTSIQPGDDDTSTFPGDDDTTSQPGDDDTSSQPGDDDTSSPTPGIGDDDTVASPTPPMGDDDSPPEPEDPYSLSGQATYEFVPYSAGGYGLDYGSSRDFPIRGAVVKLLDASNDEVIAQSTTDDDGRYSFSYDGVTQVKLWVYSKTESPPVRVEDNTSDNELYVLESSTVDASQGGTLDVHASSGWTGNAYGEPRASGPFSALDAAYEAGHRFLTETTNPPDFEQLRLNWSINNRPRPGDKDEGDITTSHWDGSELYILGQENVDTDEFDTHVIVHEWGHYFESTVSRSDSIGGGHSWGDILDPRVAFGEGWGNAISAIILDPDTVYTDSNGFRQSSGFFFDIEENDIDPSTNPGWYSETSVMAILFDLYDAPNEDFDSIESGLDPIYQVMIAGEKDTDALTSLFSFVANLELQQPQWTAEIDALLEHHSISDELGIDAVEDIWAMGETHTGGATGILPLYPERSIGESITVQLDGGDSSNTLGQNRYVKFEGDGSYVTVTTSSNRDVDVYAYERGDYMAWSAGVGTGNESISFRTSAGQTYVINVRGYSDITEVYEATVSIKN